MENYKKEKSSKQHLKIEVEQGHAQDDMFTLNTPTICGDMTLPTSPLVQSQLHNSGGTTLSNPGTPTITHTSGISRTFERLSLKGKSKNQSFFKLFGRGQGSTSSAGNGVTTTVGTAGRNGVLGVAGKSVSMDTEEFGADGSSGSDHEDPFSLQSSSGGGELSTAHSHQSEPPKSPASNAEACGMVSHESRRQHSREQYSRDSGFSSERESISHIKITPQTSFNADDGRNSPSDGDVYQAAGMEALEILHDQLQLLVKRDSDMPTDSEEVLDQIINNLSKQLDSQAAILDQQRVMETNLRFSLQQVEQRLIEAETELSHANERCMDTERKYSKMAAKYVSLKSRKEERRSSAGTTPPINCRIPKVATSPRSPRSSLPVSLSGHTPYHPPLQVNGRTLSHPLSPFSNRAFYHPPSPLNGHASQPRIPPQRVQSQTLYDRLNKSADYTTSSMERPSTTHGFHTDLKNTRMPNPSLSHTETCV